LWVMLLFRWHRHDGGSGSHQRHHRQAQ
jgi:hypothetical protein